ncbi:MAG: hypothetical protein WDN72_02980 [Alphaproteobacteria bacterium]
MASQPTHSLFFNLSVEGIPEKFRFFMATGVQDYLAPGSTKIDLPENLVGARLGPSMTRQENATQDFILQQLKSAYDQHGTLKEFAIYSHGGNLLQSHLGNVDDFLKKLEAFEDKYHIKLANRIVFAGCDTFQLDSDPLHLGPDQMIKNIEMLRNYAKNRDIELVGTTTATRDAFGIEGGRFVKFTPAGTIERDRLDNTPINNIGLISDKFGWQDCEIGHTPQAGAACIKQHHPHERS